MITTSISHIIVTSAHYTAIPKALDCEEYLVMRNWPWSLSLCAFWKKSTMKSFMTQHIFARRIIDDHLHVVLAVDCFKLW